MIAQGELITAPYRALQIELHQRPNGYGGRGSKWAVTVCGLIRSHQWTSVLDYGCGQGTLGAALRAAQLPGLIVREYDPAIPGKDGIPSFADLVTVTDVLEHVEPDRLRSVLAHLRLLARKAVFAVIALRPSNKTMADGRNAHLIVQTFDWWEVQLTIAGFTVKYMQPSRPDELVVLLT